jgi:hypothetical protein
MRKWYGLLETFRVSSRPFFDARFIAQRFGDFVAHHTGLRSTNLKSPNQRSKFSEGNDIATIKEARIVLRAQQVLKDHGLDDLPVSDAVRQLRQVRIEQVGPRQYFYDILGDCGNIPVSRCTLWYGDRAKRARNGNQRLVDFLARSKESGRELPDRIEFTRDGRKESRNL